MTSRAQRETPLATRRRKRNTGNRTDMNDILGISWKEERDLRRAMYDSLRCSQQQVDQTKSNRLMPPFPKPRIHRKASSTCGRLKLRDSGENLATLTACNPLVEEISATAVTVGDSYRTTVHSSSSLVRRSHRTVATPLYKASLATKYVALAKKKLVTAASPEVAITLPKHRPCGVSPQRFLLSYNSSSAKKRRKLDRPLSVVRETSKCSVLRRPRSPIRRYPTSDLVLSNKFHQFAEQVSTENYDETFEVLVEGEDGEFISQVGLKPKSSIRNSSQAPVWSRIHSSLASESISPRYSSSPMKLNAAIKGSSPWCSGGGHRTPCASRMSGSGNGDGQETASEAINHPQVSVSLASDTVPLNLWQDAEGNPVDTHDFVDFLCFYGTPCLSKRLSWFEKAPHLRAHKFASRASCCARLKRSAIHASTQVRKPSRCLQLPRLVEAALTDRNYSSFVLSRSVFVARKTALTNPTSLLSTPYCVSKSASLSPPLSTLSSCSVIKSISDAVCGPGTLAKQLTKAEKCITDKGANKANRVTQTTFPERDHCSSCMMPAHLIASPQDRLIDASTSTANKAIEVSSSSNRSKLPIRSTSPKPDWLGLVAAPLRPLVSARPCLGPRHSSVRPLWTSEPVHVTGPCHRRGRRRRQRRPVLRGIQTRSRTSRGHSS